MGSIRPPTQEAIRRNGSSIRTDEHIEHYLEVDGLLEENKQLRELVIQLSKLVIRNVADRK